MNPLLLPATRIEYRYRALFLVASQPVLAWLMTRFGGVEGNWIAPRIATEWAIAGSVLGALGVWIRIQAASYLSSTKIAQPDAMTDEIVQTGPFGSVRNPLYLGSLLLFTGFAMTLGWQAASLYFLFHLIRYQRVVMREEGLLKSEWGSRYDAYCHAVPRWLPRNMFALFSGSRWTGEAILGNCPFIGLAAGIIGGIWTGDLMPVLAGETLGFVIAGVFFMSRAASPDARAATVDSAAESPDLAVKS